jgi:hypothetical protein
MPTDICLLQFRFRPRWNFLKPLGTNKCVNRKNPIWPANIYFVISLVLYTGPLTLSVMGKFMFDFAFLKECCSKTLPFRRSETVYCESVLTMVFLNSNMLFYLFKKV